MGAYIVGMIAGTVCLVVSLCYLGSLDQVQVPLAVSTTIVGAVVLLISTALVAISARGKQAPAKEPPVKPAPKAEQDDEGIELPSIDDA